MCKEAAMNDLRFTGIILVILVILTIPALAAEKKEFVAAIGSDGIQHVEVLGGSYFFEPNYIVVKVNTPVELKVRKESGMVPHDFVLKAPEAGMDIQVDLKTEPTVVRFTPTKAGKYPIYCSKKPPFLESHREKGMEGVLEVRE
jgi:heme/copper-type cytochrome/quinol oxidase subunit 2